MNVNPGGIDASPSEGGGACCCCACGSGCSGCSTFLSLHKSRFEVGNRATCPFWIKLVLAALSLLFLLGSSDTMLPLPEIEARRSLSWTLDVVFVSVLPPCQMASAAIATAVQQFRWRVFHLEEPGATTTAP